MDRMYFLKKGKKNQEKEGIENDGENIFFETVRVCVCK